VHPTGAPYTFFHEEDWEFERHQSASGQCGAEPLPPRSQQGILRLEKDCREAAWHISSTLSIMARVIGSHRMPPATVSA